MKGTKRISDLITTPDLFLAGRINIIEANVSAGKTHFALNTLPAWAGSPERILYLIDTNNGEMYIQRNMNTISRQTYAFFDYNEKRVWGENEAEDKMPVLTYSGFGSAIRNSGGKFNWLDFDYIVCDEMQNLVNYQALGEGPDPNLVAAEVALTMIVRATPAKIIGMSATPKAIYDYYGTLCRDVPFDRTDLFRLETFSKSAYYQRTVEELIEQHKGKTGILYVSSIADMEHYIAYANSIGVRANGFWSPNVKTQAKHPYSPAQRDLRQCVLQNETMPADVDLLVINASSQTCIKIKHENRIVDYMIVHDKNVDVQTQVRGRYDGDLAEFFYHDAREAVYDECTAVPNEFLGVKLFQDEQDALCKYLNRRNPKRAAGVYYKWRKGVEILQHNGYKLKDGRSGNYRYWIIYPKDANSEDT